MSLVILLADWFEREAPRFVTTDPDWAPDGFAAILPTDSREAARCLLDFLAEKGLTIGAAARAGGSGPAPGTGQGLPHSPPGSG